MTGKRPIILYSALLCAQNDGRIAGRVSDSGGLPAARASVTLRNTLTGTGTRQETSGAGEYSFSGLPEGRYSLSVTGPGLDSGTKSIEIEQQAVPQVVDVRLEPAHINEEVTVVPVPESRSCKTSPRSASRQSRANRFATQATSASATS